jgi:hypothetical protein
MIPAQMTVGLDPSIQQNVAGSDSALQDALTYWNDAFQAAGRPARGLFVGAYGAANLNVSVDPGLSGRSTYGYSTVNASNGNGYFYLNPDIFSDPQTD